MAAAFRSSNATTYASRTNTTVTAPAGIQDGDVLLIFFSIGRSGGAPPTPTPPSGFALVSGTWPYNRTDVAGFQVDTRIWSKVASSESGDYTITHTSSPSQGYMCAISGAGSAQPVATQNGGNGSGGPTTATALGLTTAGDGALVLFLGADWSDTANALSPPTGTTPTFTERLDPGTVSGLMYAADGVMTTAGATGNKTHTNNTTLSSSRWAAFLLAVEADGGGGGASLVHRNLLLGVGT